MSQIGLYIWLEMMKIDKKMSRHLCQDALEISSNPYGGWAPSGALPKHRFGMISISSLAKIASLELLNSRIMVLYIIDEEMDKNGLIDPRCRGY